VWGGKEKKKVRGGGGYPFLFCIFKNKSI